MNSMTTSFAASSLPAAPVPSPNSNERPPNSGSFRSRPTKKKKEIPTVPRFRRSRRSLAKPTKKTKVKPSDHDRKLDTNGNIPDLSPINQGIPSAKKNQEALMHDSVTPNLLSKPSYPSEYHRGPCRSTRCMTRKAESILQVVPNPDVSERSRCLLSLPFEHVTASYPLVLAGGPLDPSPMQRGHGHLKKPALNERSPDSLSLAFSLGNPEIVENSLSGAVPMPKVPLELLNDAASNSTIAGSPLALSLAHSIGSRSKKPATDKGSLDLSPLPLAHSKIADNTVSGEVLLPNEPDGPSGPFTRSRSLRRPTIERKQQNLLHATASNPILARRQPGQSLMRRGHGPKKLNGRKISVVPPCTLARSQSMKPDLNVGPLYLLRNRQTTIPTPHELDPSLPLPISWFPGEKRRFSNTEAEAFALSCPTVDTVTPDIPVPEIVESLEAKSNEKFIRNRIRRYRLPINYIRETLTQDACQYDVDENDEQFIRTELFTNLGISDINVCVFEQIMEKLEEQVPRAPAEVMGFFPSVNRAGIRAVYNYWMVKRSSIAEGGNLIPGVKTSNETKTKRKAKLNPYVCFKSRGPNKTKPQTRNDVKKIEK